MKRLSASAKAQASPERATSDERDGDKSGIRILLIDDHQIFLASLRLFLEREGGFSVIGEARTKSEALEAARSLPNIILLDLDLGPENGADLLADLRKVAGDARVLVLTGLSDPELHLHAVCCGAVGVVHKLEAPNLLLKAIQRVYAGETWLNSALVANAVTRLQSRDRKKQDPDAEKIESLTARELEIIALIGEGQRNKAIAERLCISDKTVRHYLTSIFTKLEVADRLELLIYAYRHGLAQVPSKSPSKAVSQRFRVAS